MSIQQVRRSVLIAAGILALAVSGLVAGRLFGASARAVPRDTAPKRARVYDHIASELDLSDAQRTQIRGDPEAHADEILAHVTVRPTTRAARSHDAVMAIRPTRPRSAAWPRRWATSTPTAP